MAPSSVLAATKTAAVAQNSSAEPMLDHSDYKQT